jgi:hypothetical protein
MIVYISIGNSDDKLTQADWSAFHFAVRALLQDHSDITVHGEWASFPTAPFQNACWCVEFAHDANRAAVKLALRGEAEFYRQDSIAWAEVPHTEFLGPVTP